MTALLGIWLGVGATATVCARLLLESPWHLAIRGFTWPTWLPLIGVSWFRYKMR